MWLKPNDTQQETDSPVDEQKQANSISANPGIGKRILSQMFAFVDYVTEFNPGMGIFDCI